MYCQVRVPSSAVPSSSRAALRQTLREIISGEFGRVYCVLVTAVCFRRTIMAVSVCVCACTAVCPSRIAVRKEGLSCVFSLSPLKAAFCVLLIETVTSPSSGHSQGQTPVWRLCWICCGLVGFWMSDGLSIPYLNYGEQMLWLEANKSLAIL